MNDKELLQQALKILELIRSEGKTTVVGDAVMQAIRARLSAPKHWSDCAVHSEPAYPAGECDCGLVPVAWADKHDIEREGHDFYVNRQQPAKNGVPLYTAQPQREWQGLTDEEIMDLCAAQWASHPIEVARIIEAKLKEKNN